MCDAYPSSNLAIMPEDAIAAILEFASGRDLAAIQAAGSKAIHRLVDDGARRRLDALAGDVASNECVPNDALELEEHEPRCWAPADALAQLEEHEPRCWAPADAAALRRCCERARSGDWIALDGFVRYASGEFACGRIMGKHLRLFSRPSGAVLASSSSRALYVADASLELEGVVVEGAIRAHGSDVLLVDCRVRTLRGTPSSLFQLARCEVAGLGSSRWERGDDRRSWRRSRRRRRRRRAP